LHQAPLMLRGPRKMIIHHLRCLEAQLALCNGMLRSIQGG